MSAPNPESIYPIVTKLASAAPSPAEDSSLHLPRLICLHGGGTNARIFRTQCRALCPGLSAHFRLVFVDAPFLSGPGPGVESVYAEWGPFRSWMRLLAGPTEWASSVLDMTAVDTSVHEAVLKDNAAGASGPCVGFLGFSQGARIAGCLLLRQQLQEEKGGMWGQPQKHLTSRPRFGILMAGRGPLSVGNRSGEVTDPTAPVLLQLPTVHVHGMRDFGLAMHRELLHRCCQAGSAKLVEWDGDHRVPIKSKDVASVITAILEIAKKTGVIVG